MSANRCLQPQSRLSYACQWVHSKYSDGASWISKKLESDTAKYISKKFDGTGGASITSSGMFFVFQMIGLALPGAGSLSVGFKAAQYTTTAVTFLASWYVNAHKRKQVSKIEEKSKLVLDVLTIVDRKFGDAIRIRNKVNELLTTDAGFGNLCAPEELGPESLIDDEPSAPPSEIPLCNSPYFTFSRASINAASIAAIIYRILSSTSLGVQLSATALTLLIAFSREYKRCSSEAIAEKNFPELKSRTAAIPEKLNVMQKSLLGTRAELVKILKAAAALTQIPLHLSALEMKKQPIKSSLFSLLVDSKPGRYVAASVNGAATASAADSLLDPISPVAKYIISSIVWIGAIFVENRKSKLNDRFVNEMYELDQMVVEVNQLLLLAEKILVYQIEYVKNNFSGRAQQVLIEESPELQQLEEDTNRFLLASIVNLNEEALETQLDTDVNIEMQDIPEVDAAPAPAAPSYFNFFKRSLWDSSNSLTESLLDNSFTV